MDPLGERLQAALGPAYQLGAELGRGGMGVVFRATDLRLAREVAVKVLPPELGDREDLRKRFVREAQFAASLAHPNIIPIYDVGDAPSLVWFVMQFVDGESLRRRVERTGPQSVEFTARVLQDVAFGLAYVHARGVVHRDIKPDNIMLDRATGRAIIMDFGVAKALEAKGSALTGPGTFIGSVGYMSPEQAGGGGGTRRPERSLQLGARGPLLAHWPTGFRGPQCAGNPRQGADSESAVRQRRPP